MAADLSGLELGRLPRHGHRSIGSRGNIIRGMTITYNSWRKMRERCNNPNAMQYPWYGGRGIAVCARWSRFENFLRDMGERPSSNHRLCRHGDAGNYEPGNCVWATKWDNARRII